MNGLPHVSTSQAHERIWVIRVKRWIWADTSHCLYVIEVDHLYIGIMGAYWIFWLVCIPYDLVFFFLTWSGLWLWNLHWYFYHWLYFLPIKAFREPQRCDGSSLFDIMWVCGRRWEQIEKHGCRGIQKQFQGLLKVSIGLDLIVGFGFASFWVSFLLPNFFTPG